MYYVGHIVGGKLPLKLDISRSTCELMSCIVLLSLPLIYSAHFVVNI